MEREIRGGIPAEIRAEEDGIKVSGYAIVFGERANIAGLFVEVIERGALDGVLQKSDIEFLVNHRGEPLARTNSGTLKLTVDEKGLRMETDLDPADPDVQRIVPKMKRGDMNKMSFAFRMDGGLQEWDDTQDPPVRTIKKFGRIDDVSIVSQPAYEGTDIGLRSLERHREQSRKEQNFHAAQKRLRMKMNLALRERENG